MRLEPLFEEEVEQIKQQYEQRLQQKRQIYEKLIQEQIEQQRRTLEKERLTITESLLQFYFGSIDEELAAIIEPFAALSSAEYSALIPQLSNLSREELLTRFHR